MTETSVTGEPGGPRIERAAGGVLWRPVGGGGLQVAVVHRPCQDDWSLPKGKLAAGEHPLLGALREVGEETGYRPRLGAPLGVCSYDLTTDGHRAVKRGAVKRGAVKTVRYWAMLATTGEFAPGREVDRLVWLPLRDASQRVSYDTDRKVLDRFAVLPGPTAALMLVRHASAGASQRWHGPDQQRPLDERGWAQASALVGLLTSLGVRRLVSAEVVRCTDTVRPYAAATGLPVEPEPVLSETGYPGSEARAVRVLAGLAAAGVPAVACSQGTVIPDLLRRLLEQWRQPVPDRLEVKKGGWWLLHCHDGRLVAAERHHPAA